MRLHFLEASVPLTKQYARAANGTITKTPYPFVWEFTSHDETVSTLPQFEAVLRSHADLKHCLLKGSLAKPLVKESRAGSTDTNSQTEFVVLDLDGLPDSTTVDLGGKLQTAQVSIDDLLHALGLQDTSYILQWSASYGIENTALRAHLFFMLDKPTAAPLLKQWLVQLNHETALLSDAMGLTKTGNSISWALDISACQNDKLIYIAPPVLKGIKDPLKTPRITLIKRKHDKLKLPTVNATAKNRELTNKRIAELREVAGLPARKVTYKMHGAAEVMVKPDVCTITDMKQERGFVYFNLNGGDSWAYYHPENNPDLIFNFKGEPAYMTKELLPEYWEQLTSRGSKIDSNGISYLAFCDRATSTYWRGTYDAAVDQLVLHAARNETQVRHFAKQHGLPLGDFIPEWDLVFDPHDNVRCDFQTRVVNQFQPSAYMKTKAHQVNAIPRTILKVITHAVGGDPAILKHFINWLAYILQERDRTRTAWVLHGVPGTGKGILMNDILRPIFGEQQTTMRRMEELNEVYNHWMKTCLIVCVDEVQTKALQNEQGVMAKLRGFITEAMVPIREMYAGATLKRNYSNWIFYSNMPDPVSIPKNDRRTNVAKYQPNKLIITKREVEELIPKELQAFHDFLLYYAVDKEAAGSIIETADRNTLISISESSVDTVSSALLEGRFEFFLDQLPTGPVPSNALEFNKIEDYKMVLKDLLERTDRNTGVCNVSREELRILFDYTVGNMPATPNKFTSLLKHHRIHIDKVWLNAKTVTGIRLVWRDTARWSEYIKTFAPAPAAKQASKLTKVK